MRKTKDPKSPARLENLLSREDQTIARLARIKKQSHHFKTVSLAEEQAEIEAGWEVHRPYKKSVRIKAT